MNRLLYFPVFSWLLCLLALVQPCAAHYLNMTRGELVLDPAAGTAELSLRVDFTRMTGSPQRYYEITQADPDTQAKARFELFEQLKEELILQVGGERMELDLRAFEFPDLPLKKFTEAWAAPMAELVLSATLPEGVHEVKVLTSARLQIEFPFVLSLSTLGSDTRPVTRWLEPGQSSPHYVYRSESQLIGPAQAATEKEVLDVEPAVADSAFSIVVRYIELGFLHILPKGMDHILFIMGLFFLSPKWRPLLLQASLFTVAHTITLGLTVVGTIPYLPGIVEPLIALSIAYVGIENVFFRKVHSSRLVVVFVFGLIHGMGFAGMLEEIGLPDGELILALLSFNLGVEFGQVAVLFVMWLLLFRAFHWSGYRRWIQVPLSLMISAVALYWFVERVI